MLRHISFLLAFLLQPWFASSSPQRLYSTPDRKNCRCFPGDACWPDQAKWESLNRTVNGRLVATIPLASACHVNSFEPYDEAKCTAIQSNWFDPEFHIKSTSSIMAPFFANNSCNPFAPKDSPCIVGAYVQYAVDARTASDYQATINFATKHNIRLVIRNTAHDWLGKSTGSGALALRTHNLKKIAIVDYNGPYYVGKALKVGAGVSLGEAYNNTNAQGLVNVGGTCPSVGLAGGYTQGSGHGLTISTFGLGADQALEWEVVTANGDLIKATPTNEYSDLYWALSGGGGGTYAAVVSLTLQVHKDQITTGANLSWTNDGISQQTYYSGIASYLKALPTLLDAGAAGNWVNSNSSFSVSPFVGVGITKEKMDSLHQPILDELESLGINYTYYSATFSSFLDMYTEMNPTTEMGILQIGSRLIPREVITTASENLTTSLRAINEQAGAWISGLAFNVSKPPIVPNAVNPAWRESSISLVIGTFYNYTNWDMNIENQRLMTDSLIPQLSRLIPGGGTAYLNEGDPWEPEWQKVFYGENYDRLLRVKHKYDPNSTFYARTAVGSEEWIEAMDGRLCKV
ncbi:FAD-binding domain-containing protein [Corynespora cassiicola Philippines]|uniref:FAD-binding domain-containing protein n=1 Tax=Corynespora cassiicola Philippines TaxID=1448308 RepID=A0A2T2NHX8_CORCC|nr:FAD-binding domain-containing protein [Corynespora cassiicola Philippines]